MRNMSFALTKEQILNKSKTVTRRLGWKFLKLGDLIQPVEKCVGLRDGETITKIGLPIRIISVDKQSLDSIDQKDVKREGFPDLTPRGFILMFCKHMRCLSYSHVRRIEFEYTEPDIDAGGK